MLSYGYHGQSEATAAKFSEGANADMVRAPQQSWECLGDLGLSLKQLVEGLGFRVSGRGAPEVLGMLG